jgi:hypothetical protein
MKKDGGRDLKILTESAHQTERGEWLQRELDIRERADCAGYRIINEVRNEIIQI